ncbi:MAG: ABC transporter ATP-binding protein/permease [Oscillospiraceae bacterium]|nr:ABC transporter ATP-binding protein/permease [Oscillospiraceae bacterium]
MLPLDTLSGEVEQVLKKFGVDIENIIIATVLDLDSMGDFGESWLCLTKEYLYCLSASSQDYIYDSKIKTKNKNKKVTPDGQSDESYIKSKFSNPEFKQYQVEKITSAYIDSFTSTNRFFAVIDDITVSIAFSTNSKKQKLFAFLEIMKRIQEGKEVKDDDAIFEQFNIFCPKCGRRYRNQNRKICMNCVDKNMLFMRLLKYFDKHVNKLIIVFATLLLTSGITLINPIIHGRIFVDIVVGGDKNPDNLGFLEFLRGNILTFVLMILAIDLCSILIRIMRARTVNKMSISVTQKMKTDMFSAMQKLSLAYFNNNQTGRLMNRINSDPEVIRGFYTDIIPSFVFNVITFIGVTIAMFLMNWKLTLIVFIPVPVIVWIFRTQLPRLWRMFSRRWRRSSSLNSMLGDSLNNIRVVKAFAKEVEEGNRFRKYSDRLYQADLKVNITRLSIFPVVSLLMGITSNLIWGFGGINVINQFMSYGELLTYMNFIMMIFGPLQFFATLTDQITEMTNSAQRMFEVLDTPRDIVDTENPVKLENLKGEIEFDDVCFHYVANRPILRNMSFNIKQGDYIGLVGHTGAGKSTIANLITRMYDVISGSIKIDGYNIKNIEIQTLRKNIAIVSQEIFIFRGTVAENIRYAKPDATIDEIIAASKAANAHDFIVNMPEGYETIVGTGSRSMSGGEQQRISIARALLLDPKILILDEATAAMDTDTERQIQEAINILVKGRTTIVIAHRLSTLKECNYLFAIENGEVAESGDHIELIRQKGIYYKLYKLQSDAMKRVIAGE